jgi:hypothetical protein
MKAPCILAIILMPLFGFAQWTPPDNPDPVTILREAQADASAGRFDVALAKHVWFHENALKYQRGLYGVRLSFALSYWYELAEAYPPALAKLKEFRDDATTKVMVGKEIREAFHDLVAINRTLGEEVHTKEVFVGLDADNPAAAKEVFELAQPALIRAKEYTLCGRYLDAEESFGRIVERFRMHQELAERQQFGDRLRRFAEKEFTNRCATLVALLVVNKQEKEAKDLAVKAKAEWEDAAFRAEIDKALEGHVPDPWP